MCRGREQRDGGCRVFWYRCKPYDAPTHTRAKQSLSSPGLLNYSSKLLVFPPAVPEGTQTMLAFPCSSFFIKLGFRFSLSCRFSGGRSSVLRRIHLPVLLLTGAVPVVVVRVVGQDGGNMREGKRGQCKAGTDGPSKTNAMVRRFKTG